MKRPLGLNKADISIELTPDISNGVQQEKTLEMLALAGDKGFDDGRFFQVLELVGIEPHIPLVKDPVDPKTVRDPKRVPGITRPAVR